MGSSIRQESRLFEVAGKNMFATFCLICSLFLLWGFCNGMIDVMDKHFQDKLHLTKAQSAWVQTAHYLGYALMALPAGMLARAVGYKGGIISGLLLVSLGGFWFIAATQIASFWAFLLGVSVIAMGLTILETVANPYATVLGPQQYGAMRINLAQAFNGIGWILGPIVGASFFYSAGGVEVAHGRLYVPYVAVGVVVLMMAMVFYFRDVPDLESEAKHDVTRVAQVNQRSMWTYPHFVGAVVAQFFYVAAQAGIFSFFINYVVEEAPAIVDRIAASAFLQNGATLRDGAWFINEQGAARLQGLIGFGLFLLGRLIGTVLLGRTPADRLLGTYSLLNVGLCALVVLKLGWISTAAVCLSFFFMSISFPTIFALGIHKLGSQTKQASAFIVMAILGGALMPRLMGRLGDVYDMSTAFLMPMACFLLIALYGYSWRSLSNQQQSFKGQPA